MSSLHQGFQATDQPADTEAIFGWLDRMNGSPLILQVKRRMLEVRPVGEGDQVLDVGCGLGHEVFRLAELVGPQGRVTGIDANSAMITEARRRAAGLTLPIAFEVGDARRCRFPGQHFRSVPNRARPALPGQAGGSAGGDGAPGASRRIRAGL